MTYDLDTLGSRLRRIRCGQGLSQQALADLSGLKRGAIAHYESGKNCPSLPALVALAKALHRSADELLGGDE